MRDEHGAVDAARRCWASPPRAEDDLAARPSHHDLDDEHDHDDFESFAVALPAVADPPALAARLGAVIAAHDMLRLKGFLDVPGKEMPPGGAGRRARASRHISTGRGAPTRRAADAVWS